MWDEAESLRAPGEGAIEFGSRADVPERFRKVLAAWRWDEYSRHERMTEFKSRLRDSVLACLSERGMTINALARDMGVDSRPLYAFLGKGVLSRMSYGKACAMAAHLGLIR